jgi:hypothetical protein
VAALVLRAQTQARDGTAEMFCRRVAMLTKRAREELEALKAAHEQITERLVAAYRSVGCCPSLRRAWAIAHVIAVGGRCCIRV